jgi:hypothetical protein
MEYLAFDVVKLFVKKTKQVDKQTIFGYISSANDLKNE